MTIPSLVQPPQNIHPSSWSSNGTPNNVPLPWKMLSYFNTILKGVLLKGLYAESLYITSQAQMAAREGAVG